MHLADTNLMLFKIVLPVSWLSGNVFVSGAGGLWFKSRAGQIGHSAANILPPLQHFFEKEWCCPGQMTRRWALQAHYTLQRNTASTKKDLINTVSLPSSINKNCKIWKKIAFCHIVRKTYCSSLHKRLLMSQIQKLILKQLTHHIFTTIVQVC